jgi:hypothetical protein
MFTSSFRRFQFRTAFSAALAAVPAAASVLYQPSLSTDSLTVGDRVRMVVPMVVPSGAKVNPPDPEKEFGCFLVKEWSGDRTERASSDSLTFTYVFTQYTTEQCTVGPLSFVHIVSDSQSDTLRTGPVSLRLVSVVPSDTASLRDLKPPLSAGTPSLAWLWAVLIAGACAALFIFGRRLYRKMQKPSPPPPPKPPYEEAIEALAALDARQYLMKGMVREHVFGLSDIMKRYIERRFVTNASEFTTDEMLSWLETAPLDTPLRRMCEWFFTNTDPVKFAKFVPDRDTITRFCTDARDFIEKTRPPAQPQAAATVEEGKADAVQEP